MRIAPDGGTAQPVFEINGSDAVGALDLSPDGSRIALHPHPLATQTFSPQAGPHNAVWVLNLAALKVIDR